MVSDFTSDQRDPTRCGHCGVRLAGRFARCPACHRGPAESLGVRALPVKHLKVPLSHTPFIHAQSVVPARLPARKNWRGRSRMRTEPYYAILEGPEAAPAPHGMRRPLTLGVSVLAVTSALYLGFIHSDETSVGTPMAVSGKVKAQPAVPPVAIVRHAAPERPALVRAPPPAKPAPVPQQVAAVAPAQHAVSTSASAETKHALASPPGNVVEKAADKAADKARADASRQLRSARANLQRNNLSATKTRVAAALAAQPDNRDALNLRDTVAAREQQRDASLSVARGCSYVARWACVWHNAGNALAVDSSSKEALRLVDLSMRESELASAWPAQPVAAPPVDERGLAINHH